MGKGNTSKGIHGRKGKGKGKASKGTRVRARVGHHQRQGQLMAVVVMTLLPLSSITTMA
jgi:hypothetical protein